MFNRVITWLPLASLSLILMLARVRALMLRRRGVRVVIIDYRRQTRELVYDTLAFVLAMFWLYLLVAEAWPFSLAWLPSQLAYILIDLTTLKILAHVLVVAAPFIFAAALGSFGASWRIGVDRETPGPLVTTGIFAWVRNPIYLAFDLLLFGSFLIHGRVVFALLACAIASIVHTVILREERFLAERFGDSFHNYCRQVGRYCPWI